MIESSASQWGGVLSLSFSLFPLILLILLVCFFVLFVLCISLFFCFVFCPFVSLSFGHNVMLWRVLSTYLSNWWTAYVWVRIIIVKFSLDLYLPPWLTAQEWASCGTFDALYWNVACMDRRFYLVLWNIASVNRRFCPFMLSICLTNLFLSIPHSFSSCHLIHNTNEKKDDKIKDVFYQEQTKIRKRKNFPFICINLMFKMTRHPSYPDKLTLAPLRSRRRKKGKSLRSSLHDRSRRHQCNRKMLKRINKVW